MAAGVGIAVTAIPVVRNTAIDVSVSEMAAATNAGTLVTDTDFFTITAPVEDQKIVILLNNGTGAVVTANVVDGDMFASIGDSPDITLADGVTFALTIDTAKYKTAEGTIIVLLTNAGVTALNAGTAANVGCLLLG